MAKDVEIPLDKMFGVWLLVNKWENKTPDYYATKFENLRIQNGGITPRKWQLEIFDGNDPVSIQWVTSNGREIHYVHNGTFYTYDVDTDTNTSIGSISHTGSVDFIVYGIYTIILTWTDFPRVYNGSTLTQTTASNLKENANPSFGESYAWFTVVNDNDEKNIIHVSWPISAWTQENAFNWKATGSEQISLGSDILGFESTLQLLRVFTNNTIETMSKDSLTNVWGVASLFTTPIGQWDDLLNAKCTTNANEFIFYITKSLKIKSINYIQGNIVPQIATISDPIEQLLENELHADQSWAFMYYDKAESLIVCAFRSLTGTENDIHVIYDLISNERITDTRKSYTDLTLIGEDMYASSAYSYRLIKDNHWLNDFDQPVPIKFQSWKITLWDPVLRKQIRGCKVAWKYNQKTVLQWVVELDWQVIMNKTISWAWLGYQLNEWIGSNAIGDDLIWWEIFEPVSELEDFERDATTWALRLAGKKIRIIITWWEVNQDFIVDYAHITIRPKRRTRRADRV